MYAVGLPAVRSEWPRPGRRIVGRPVREYHSGGSDCFLEEAQMKRRRRRLIALSVLSSGTLLASSCSGVADQIIATLRLAFGIADIWV